MISDIAHCNTSPRRAADAPPASAAFPRRPPAMKWRMRMGLATLIGAAAPMSIVPATNPPRRIAIKSDVRIVHLPALAEDSTWIISVAAASPATLPIGPSSPASRIEGQRDAQRAMRVDADAQRLW